MSFLKVYDFCSEDSRTKERLSKKWGLRRIYRHLSKSFPHVGETILLNHILRICKEMSIKPSSKQLWGLKKQIRGLEKDETSIGSALGGIITPKSCVT